MTNDWIRAQEAAFRAADAARSVTASTETAAAAWPTAAAARAAGKAAVPLGRPEPRAARWMSGTSVAHAAAGAAVQRAFGGRRSAPRERRIPDHGFATLASFGAGGKASGEDFRTLRDAVRAWAVAFGRTRTDEEFATKREPRRPAGITSVEACALGGIDGVGAEDEEDPPVPDVSEEGDFDLSARSRGARSPTPTPSRDDEGDDRRDVPTEKSDACAITADDVSKVASWGYAGEFRYPGKRRTPPPRTGAVCNPVASCLRAIHACRLTERPSDASVLKDEVLAFVTHGRGGDLRSTGLADKAGEYLEELAGAAPESRSKVSTGVRLDVVLFAAQEAAGRFFVGSGGAAEPGAALFERVASAAMMWRCGAALRVERRAEHVRVALAIAGLVRGKEEATAAFEGTATDAIASGPAANRLAAELGVVGSTRGRCSLHATASGGYRMLVSVAHPTPVAGAEDLVPSGYWGRVVYAAGPGTRGLGDTLPQIPPSHEKTPAAAKLWDTQAMRNGETLAGVARSDRATHAERKRQFPTNPPGRSPVGCTFVGTREGASAESAWRLAFDGTLGGGGPDPLRVSLDDRRVWSDKDVQEDVVADVRKTTGEKSNHPDAMRRGLLRWIVEPIRAEMDAHASEHMAFRPSDSAVEETGRRATRAFASPRIAPFAMAWSRRVVAASRLDAVLDHVAPWDWRDERSVRDLATLGYVSKPYEGRGERVVPSGGDVRGGFLALAP